MTAANQSIGVQEHSASDGGAGANPPHNKEKSKPFAKTLSNVPTKPFCHDTLAAAGLMLCTMLLAGLALACALLPAHVARRKRVIVSRVADAVS